MKNQMISLNAVYDFLDENPNYEIICRITPSMVAIRMSKLAVIQDFADCIDLSGKLEDFWTVGFAFRKQYWSSESGYSPNPKDLLNEMKRECDEQVEDEYVKTLEKLGFNEFM